ncbi:hypothetical protein [Synechocystis sp. PCC 7509]|uniref:hypothetical protein n=1 Tax=Synechocystis sp. PCC 7509 TaxID=927677 RepID=UPI0002AC83FF|nr:hypothetical protein [Synechocystis sp. PCC 7509]
MQKSILQAAILSISLVTIGASPLQAQTPVSLVQAKCVNSGLGTFRQTPLDVAVAKAIYTSPFYLGTGTRSAAVTCKIRNDDDRPLFQTLRLGLGMRDNNPSSPPVTVNFYVDGDKTETKTISPGIKELVAIDVSKATNITIEAICSTQSRYCEALRARLRYRIYFFNTILEPLVVTTPTK